MKKDIELAQIIATFAEDARLQALREIPGFLASRGIEKLYHFTSIKNLSSLARNGFLGRETLISQSHEFIASDFVRHEPIENAICFSLSKPNNYMAARKITSGHELVLLEIGNVSELLTTFCFISAPGNFGSPVLKAKLENWPEEFIGGKGLLNLFVNEFIRSKYEIPDSEPTDPQSEILMLDPIPWRFVTKLISPGLKGYASQSEVRDVLKTLPQGVVFQSQNVDIFPSIDWKDPSVIAEFNERRWSDTWS
jgi:hypothetical protein